MYFLLNYSGNYSSFFSESSLILKKYLQDIECFCVSSC